MNSVEFEKHIIEEAIKSSYILPLSLKKTLKDAVVSSKGLEKKILERIIENINIAQKSRIPVCQDTGVFEIWLKIGKESVIKNINFSKVIKSAVKKAHRKGGLRASMSEITPVLHTSFTEGKTIEVILTPRGFGSENYSFLHMMNPESTFTDIKEQILEDVKIAGGRPCPPYIIGVGIGGTASKAVELSCEALTEVNFKHSVREKEILKDINKIGTGAGGVGGRHTALGIKIKHFPQHIAGLAVGVHIGCWCNRVRRFTIK